MMTLIFYPLCAHSDTLKNMHSYQIQGVLTTLKALQSICEHVFCTYLKKTPINLGFTKLKREKKNLSMCALQTYALVVMLVDM